MWCRATLGMKAQRLTPPQPPPSLRERVGAGMWRRAMLGMRPARKAPVEHRSRSADMKKAGNPRLFRTHHRGTQAYFAASTTVPFTGSVPSGEDGSTTVTVSTEPSGQTIWKLLPGSSVENGIPLCAR